MGLKRSCPLNELSNFKVGKTWVFVLKYVLPILIIVVWAFGLVRLLNDANSFKITVGIIILIVVVGFLALFTKLNPNSKLE